VLGDIYMDYLESTNKGNPSITDAWINRFRMFDTRINTKGAPNGFQAIGITDLYNNDKIAKIYIPYSLPENLILSFYTWQLSLHDFLNSKNETSFAKPKPKIRIITTGSKANKI
jgi:hypothetical protein